MTDAPGDDGTEFSRTLDRYKQRGCRILVTGEVPSDVVDLVSRKLMGAPDAERTRLFALLDRAPDTVVSRLPSADPRDAYLVETPEIARHASPDATSEGFDAPVVPAAQAATGPDAETPTQVGDGVDAFRDATTAAIAELGAQTTEPSELRVAVDSLRPILDHGTTAATDFVTAVGEELERTRSMGHFVLPIAHDAPAVTTLEPAVDVSVRLAVENGRPVQSWRLPENDLETDWLLVEE